MIITSTPVLDASVAQRESIAFTRRGSQVQSLPLAPFSPIGQRDPSLTKPIKSGIFATLRLWSVLEPAA